MPSQNSKNLDVKVHAISNPIRSFRRNFTGQTVRKLRSLKVTVGLGKSLGHLLRGGEVIALIGDLGTGKTTLVRGIVAGAGISPQVVSSPTFTIIQEYQGKILVAHVDLFRIESLAELETIGLHEYYNNRTVVLIEWADRVHGYLPADHLRICLEHSSRHQRLARFQAHGSRSTRLLKQLTKTPIFKTLAS